MGSVLRVGAAEQDPLCTMTAIRDEVLTLIRA
jgi:hypothetical protein